MVSLGHPPVQEAQAGPIRRMSSGVSDLPDELHTGPDFGSIVTGGS
jgi:hypothetical protein